MFHSLLLGVGFRLDTFSNSFRIELILEYNLGFILDSCWGEIGVILALGVVLAFLQLPYFQLVQRTHEGKLLERRETR